MSARGVGPTARQPVRGLASADGLVHTAGLRAVLQRARENPRIRKQPLAEQVVLWQQLAESLAGQVTYLEDYAVTLALDIGKTTLPRSARRGTRWAADEVQAAIAAERVLLECEQGRRPATGTLRWYEKAWRLLGPRLRVSPVANALMKRAAVRILALAGERRGA